MPLHTCEIVVHHDSTRGSKEKLLTPVCLPGTTHLGQKHLLLIVEQNVSQQEIEGLYSLDGFDCVRLIRTDRHPTSLQSDDLMRVLTWAHLSYDHAHERFLYFSRHRASVSIALALFASAIEAVPLGNIDELLAIGPDYLDVKRKGFSGRLELIERIEASICTATLRASGKLEQPDAAPSTQIKWLDAKFDETLPMSVEITKNLSTHDEPSLNDARLVVSGGRGVNSQETFDLLRQLASLLNGALGASLPAVDAGFSSVTRQIGQSGNYVSPVVYLAVGISGTPQHLAGIDPISAIVAINSDEQAGIFDVSTLGVVADCNTFIGLLLQEIKKLKST